MSDEGIRELEDALKIDEHGLDDALLEQPDIFYRVARTLALMISRRDLAKVELSDRESTVDLAFRRDAQIAEDKITEAEVKNNVRQDKEVKKLRAHLMSL